METLISERGSRNARDLSASGRVNFGTVCSILKATLENKQNEWNNMKWQTHFMENCKTVGVALNKATYGGNISVSTILLTPFASVETIWWNKY